VRGVIMSFVRCGIAAVVLSGVVASQALAQTKITIGTVGSGNTLEWPLYIAEKKGFLEQEKLALEWVGVQSSAAVMQQVAAGSLDLGTTGLADSLRAADKGAPTRLVRIGVGGEIVDRFAPEDCYDRRRERYHAALFRGHGEGERACLRRV